MDGPRFARDVEAPIAASGGIVCAPMTIEHAIAIASQHHEAGRLTEAERIYRWILAQRPITPMLAVVGMLACRPVVECCRRFAPPRASIPSGSS